MADGRLRISSPGQPPDRHPPPPPVAHTPLANPPRPRAVRGCSKAWGQLWEEASTATLRQKVPCRRKKASCEGSRG
eukprot:6214444-Pleurochrysis_carterae.AAC.5